MVTFGKGGRGESTFAFGSGSRHKVLEKLGTATQKLIWHCKFISNDFFPLKWTDISFDSGTFWPEKRKLSGYPTNPRRSTLFLSLKEKSKWTSGVEFLKQNSLWGHLEEALSSRKIILLLFYFLAYFALRTHRIKLTDSKNKRIIKQIQKQFLFFSSLSREHFFFVVVVVVVRM